MREKHLSPGDRSSPQNPKTEVLFEPCIIRDQTPADVKKAWRSSVNRLMADRRATGRADVKLREDATILDKKSSIIVVGDMEGQ